MKKMNVTITSAQMKRIHKCVIGMSNMMNCVNHTQITFPTLKAIIDRGFCSSEQLTKLMTFCNAVENNGK